MKNASIIRVLAIFLLVLIPLIYLYAYFDSYAFRESNIEEELIKDKFLTEMDRFQEDLKPEVYVEKAFRDLEKTFNFPDLKQSQYKFSLSEKDKPNFINEGFIAQARSFLKEKYGLSPFVIISSGYDFSNLDLYDKYNYFENQKNRNSFAFSCIGAILFFNLYGINEGILNCLYFFYPENKASFIKNMNNIIKYNFRNNELDIKTSFSLEVIKYFSIFYKELGRPNKAFSFFSNNLGNQRLYQFYNSFIFKENNKYYLLGLYYALIKSIDIPLDKLLYLACTNKTDNSNKSIKRTISDKVVKVPEWELEEDRIIYRVPFPFHFYNLILEHKVLNEDMYKIFNNYFQKHSLELSIDRSVLRNEYYTYKEYTLYAIFIIIVVLILYLFNLIFKLINIRISLSRKIRLVVAVAVLIPMTGLFFLSNIIIRNRQRSYLTNIEQKMSERMNLFDKLKDDIIYDFAFDLLEHKKIITDTYNHFTSKKFYSEFINNNNNISIIKLFFKNYKEIYYNLFANISILDKNGDNVAFFNDYQNGIKQDLKKFVNLYRYLSDLNLLKLSRENEKYKKHFGLTMSVIEEYVNTNTNRNILANECKLIPSEGLNLNDRITYQFITSEKNPNDIEALIYSWVPLRDIMSFRMTKTLVEKFPKLLNQEIEGSQAKYAFFERSSSDYREKIPQPRTYPFRQLQIEALNKAMEKGQSGREVVETDRYYYLKLWRYYIDTPIVSVGVAVIPKRNVNFFSVNIVITIFIMYVLLVVVLLSDFFVDALLEPIRTLSKFVKEIKQDHININIDMKSGDELEELGDSFNKMSLGLCEREKLKRFVSDKLFNSIEKNSEQKIAKTRVTILSSDIRSFTTISEKNSPEDVVNLLNDYFTLMEKSIVKYGGSIEKIVGDAISAAFYEEKSNKYALNACKASLEMRENLKKFNQERKAKGLFTIENGIGLATGDVIIGFAGKKARRREFLLIGKILKLAENLEAMTKKAVSSKVFIDSNTFELVKDNIEICPENSEEEMFYRELSI